MNNEPVAWMRENEVWEGKYNFSKEKPPAYPNAISLYTNPVKELSRMDVYELAIESGFMLSTQYGEAEHKLMPVSDGDTLVKLANAILRKAQEK